MPVVAIDGPVGSGKSTVARAVAAHLGLPTLETGAMYRAVALAALRRGLAGTAGTGPPGELVALARSLELEVGERVHLGGEDVTAELRSPAVNAVVSQVATDAGVRAELVARQRAWVAAHGGGVVEGRDIGTVVLPEAELKVYLTATEAERVRRRIDEDPDVVRRRDVVDSTRGASPLAVASDAVVVDTTGRSVADLVEEIVGLLGRARDR